MLRDVNGFTFSLSTFGVDADLFRDKLVWLRKVKAELVGRVGESSKMLNEDIWMMDNNTDGELGR